uniref:Dermaseptin-N1 n=1 Tax=Pithecopus nordestinus TaxID=2034992 RepID=DRS1_PITNO|nr:RecName: Full=Dermaseptin-N1; Short=DRS-N1; AltName: Full=Dermaseptin-H10; Short=DRS-H10 [Pithecopus nordestinus]
GLWSTIKNVAAAAGKAAIKL